MNLLIASLVKNNLRSIIRDRVLYAVLGVSVLMILLIPFLSGFSMRQVQELAISLSLSTLSGALLVVTLLLGASSIWRDFDRRYTSSILTLPLSRAVFMISKFVSITLFLILCTLVLGAGCAVVILIAANSYPSDIPIHWNNILLALVGDILKYQLLASFALCLSAVSTSFYLPFFGTLAIYFCGSASQEVFEYVSSQAAEGVSSVSVEFATAAYYLVPNLSSFDFQVQAVYGLDVPLKGFLLTTAYAAVYSALLLGMAIFAFGRRELP